MRYYAFGDIIKVFSFTLNGDTKSTADFTDLNHTNIQIDEVYARLIRNALSALSSFSDYC